MESTHKRKRKQRRTSLFFSIRRVFQVKERFLGQPAKKEKATTSPFHHLTFPSIWCHSLYFPDSLFIYFFIYMMPHFLNAALGFPYVTKMPFFHLNIIFPKWVFNNKGNTYKFDPRVKLIH